MEPIKCTEEMDKFFSRLAEFKKELKECADTFCMPESDSYRILYDKLHEFFKVEGEE